MISSEYEQHKVCLLCRLLAPSKLDLPIDLEHWQLLHSKQQEQIALQASTPIRTCESCCFIEEHWSQDVGICLLAICAAKFTMRLRACMSCCMAYTAPTDYIYSSFCNRG